MSGAIKRLLTCIVVAAVVGGLVLGLVFWPQLRFRAGLARLRVSAAGIPMYRQSTEGSIDVDTFSDNVSSREISDLYYVACHRLDELRAGHPRRTYHWHDLEGWDRVVSVVQFSSGYIAVFAGCNNDCDSVSAMVAPGIHRTKPHPDYSPDRKELPDDRLPRGMLRYEWEKTP